MTDTVTQENFWDRLGEVQAGLLSLDSARPVPMSPYVDRGENALWFITAKGTDLETGLRAGPRPATFAVASSDAGLYANIEGKAQLSSDAAKLDEIWNVVADSWFDGGQADPDVQLVRLELSEAEAWATTGALGFFYEIAKAQMSEEKPDMGSHGVLKFAA